MRELRPEDIEKYSSAITLSDMEVFVFPELMYSLVLANIMSPLVWKWREEECFKKLEGKSTHRRLLRLRQFIMDEFEFNLDLETWGLTRQETELERFEKFISPDDIASSNALFGYSGDKYYFSVDIRKHFGLDKYDQETIPYWKTETAEAMAAFKHCDGYDRGAGECVSLATLYAAAAFVICGVPLEDIYLVLTPLHSQNYLDTNGGVVTNNRRIVTKGMWFNGTAISMKAQRAMKNEQITVVTHNTGSIHCFYDDATIDKDKYLEFSKKLKSFLQADFGLLMFSNFLRAKGEYQKYFQFCRERRGQHKFINAETLFHYEHDSNYRIADETYDKLLAEVSDEDFTPYKRPDRMCCEQLRAFAEYEKIDLTKAESVGKLREYLTALIPDVDEFMEELLDFLLTKPKLPDCDKNFVKIEAINFSVDKSREEIITYLEGMREKSVTADLAFYAYRDMASCNWQPFIKASVERNPVSIDAASAMDMQQVHDWLLAMKNESIYDGTRLAQPDEVVNFSRGDGLEKAIVFANIAMAKLADRDIEIIADKENITVRADQEYKFVSKKGFEKKIQISGGNVIAN